VGTGRLGENGWMNISYTRSTGAGLTYDIEADKHGNYTVKLNGKVIKRVTALSNYLGKPRWGSKKLEADANEDAKKAIEGFKTDAG
jgi:hypothetical protein